ncbi:MAG TPA: DNA polymerase III subunit delta [Blastocatellia bacterium]|nr:DNA polymerase III subunit delta [Blastocatellia bacterium]HMV87674.1 DNA polymerase III subunit delta [Blastocatellia bacterium]HMY74242.1 DNA polymerase III subunit delta [Blastocatellia bacterium]HNG30290.1 DNA polymerase III subunit delta [Blastocatellia bacterium]
MKRQTSQDALKSQSDFHRKLQKRQFASLYLFEGSESYLRDQALKSLTEVAVDAGLRDFNYAAISVTQGNLDEALAVARQFPMISERRMVVVTGFEAISDDVQLELLKAYLRQPVETTVLAFVSPGLDNRRNISTMLRKGCEVVNFEALDERDGAPNWVRDYVTRAGCSIDMASAAYLVGMVGVDLMRLAAEADKLIAYVGDKGRITQDEIDLLVRHSREHSNFELTDAIVDGDRRKALNLLHRIFDNASENPQSLSLMILGAIAGNYRKMLGAKELMKQNAPNSEVAKLVGMSPYVVGRFNEKVRRIETARILKGIERIAATDVALKTSMATPRLLLETLVCELCPSLPERRYGR